MFICDFFFCLPFSYFTKHFYIFYELIEKFVLPFRPFFYYSFEIIVEKIDYPQIHAFRNGLICRPNITF